MLGMAQGGSGDTRRLAWHRVALVTADTQHGTGWLWQQQMTGVAQGGFGNSRRLAWHRVVLARVDTWHGTEWL